LSATANFAFGHPVKFTSELRRLPGTLATMLAELQTLLRPAGGGVHLVSTGRDAQEQLQRTIYQAESTAQITEKFHRALRQIADAKAVILAVPSDVGAGFRRGANLGPQAIRRALYTDAYRDKLAAAGVVDIGDVFVVPQLLDDEMLSEAQRARTHAEIYPGHTGAPLPVAPLSITERVLAHVLRINPRIVPFVLGGDHSVAWPVAKALHQVHPDMCIVQVDAHTDLLRERLGIRYCFASWSYHANELLKRDGRLLQYGIRASRYDRGHWERELGVQQFWATECADAPERVLATLQKFLDDRKIDKVYFSNDVDGTDAAFASATGTPEEHGLSPAFVGSLIDLLGTRIVCADIMEVAPDLGPTPEHAKITVKTAVSYTKRSLARALGDDSLLP
jgi:arginase family enzyme